MDQLPHVTVTNLDSDDPITFPAADPDCLSFTPMEVDKSQIAMMQRQLEKMRRQQLLMEQQLKASRVNEATSVPASEVEEDTPGNLPRGLINAGG